MRIAGRNIVDFIEQIREVVAVDHFVVAYPSVAAAVKMTKLGVAGYLAKPTSATVIVDGVRGAIAGNESSELTRRWIETNAVPAQVNGNGRCRFRPSSCDTR